MYKHHRLRAALIVAAVVEEDQSLAVAAQLSLAMAHVDPHHHPTSLVPVDKMNDEGRYAGPSEKV